MRSVVAILFSLFAALANQIAWAAATEVGTLPTAAIEEVVTWLVALGQ